MCDMGLPFHKIIGDLYLGRKKAPRYLATQNTRTSNPKTALDFINNLGTDCWGPDGYAETNFESNPEAMKKLPDLVITVAPGDIVI